MQCRDVEVVIEQEGLAPLPEAARTHVAGCKRCQEFVADLQAIVSAAERLPAEIEAPERVWASLRTQLELEGIIKERAAVPLDERLPWWRGIGRMFRSRALATVTAGALIAAAGFLQLWQRGELPSSPLRMAPDIGQTAKLLNEQEIDWRNMNLASSSPVDTSLQQDLQQVDDFIADCERHLKDAPQDDLAREYLASAYQQKAELLAVMMERGRSVN